jgi:hypothetical protein
MQTVFWQCNSEVAADKLRAVTKNVLFRIPRCRAVVGGGGVKGQTFKGANV